VVVLTLKHSIDLSQESNTLKVGSERFMADILFKVMDISVHAHHFLLQNADPINAMLILRDALEKSPLNVLA